jgi:L-alanine-DL-glutamate epimerase-like enolase superfamily enzyme
MKLWLEKRHLNLKVNWKLSRNQTTFKENFIVHLETHIGNFDSEIAPNVRYGESVQNIQEQFDFWLTSQDLKILNSVAALTESLKMIKLHSLRFGLESVFLNLIAKENNQTLTQFLELPAPIKIATSFSMPITPIADIADYLKPLSRFHSLKIKVDAETGKDMLQEIRKHTNAKLRVDANEGWKSLEDFMLFQDSLAGMNIELIEQPFPSSMIEEYKELKKHTPYKILADESIEDVGEFFELAKQFHAVNIKLMKTGSLLKAKQLLLDAKKHGMSAMMGCMIETTIGISYGMLFGGLVEYVDLDGFLLIKEEPFHLVTEAEGILSLT